MYSKFASLHGFNRANPNFSCEIRLKHNSALDFVRIFEEFIANFCWFFDICSKYQLESISIYNLVFMKIQREEKVEEINFERNHIFFGSKTILQIELIIICWNSNLRQINDFWEIVFFLRIWYVFCSRAKKIRGFIKKKIARILSGPVHNRKKYVKHKIFPCITFYCTFLFDTEHVLCWMSISFQYCAIRANQ